MSVMIVPVTGQGVAAVMRDLMAVYRRAFACPPYNEGEAEFARFAERLPRHAQRPGFQCYVARSSDKGRLVGFTYGYSWQQGVGFWDTIERELGPELAQVWLPGSFEFVELAVDPSVQGQGIGSQLHDTLFANIPHPKAVLFTAQGETAAVRLYRKRGWTVLLSDIVFPGGDLPHYMLGRQLESK